jgi:hypothetical protein
VLSRRDRWAFAVTCTCFWIACATSREAVRPKPKPRPAPVAPAKLEPPTRHASTVQVRGLHGTLTDADVHETMEGRQHEFGRCIATSRRSLRLVSGTIQFAFKVGGDGRVTDLRCVESTIGHRILEQCLTLVVGETQFPRPAGGGSTARFSWEMMVEPASGKPPEEIDPDVLKPVLKKHARELFHNCDVDRARERFHVTAYLAKDGRVLSAGATATPARADDKLDCVLLEFGSWRIPKLHSRGKLSFVLH